MTYKSYELQVMTYKPWLTSHDLQVIWHLQVMTYKSYDLQVMTYKSYEL
jgi:hypothetical protein